MMTKLLNLLVWFCLVIRCAPAKSIEDSENIIVLKNATIIDGTGSAPIENGLIIIEENIITEVGKAGKIKVPKSSTVIDCSGKYIIPGLIDFHAHTYSSEERANLLKWGITTIFNPNAPINEIIKQRSEGTSSNSVARFFTAGPLIGSKDFVQLGGIGVENLNEIQKAIQELKSAGVDAIKLFYDDLGYIISPLEMMKKETMQLVISAAHQVGLRVFVHALYLEKAKEALKAGADGLLHSIVSDYVDEEFLNLMLERGAFYVPTLSVFEAESDINAWGHKLEALDSSGALQAIYDSLQNSATSVQFRKNFINTPSLLSQLPVIRENLIRVSKAGIPIVMGTDSNAPGVVLCISSLMELELEVKSGLTTMEALQSATKNAAKALGLSASIGTIAPGKKADLVVLNANPILDIRALVKNDFVIFDGNLILK